MIVAGCISGTSIDGIDVAVGEFGGAADGRLTLRALGARTFSWSAQVRRDLLELLPPATTTVEQICRLDVLTGREIAAAVSRAIDEFAGGAADFVVSHGQTVFHWVADGRSQGGLQLGQPAAIVERTGLPVVSDVRSRDIAAGGQGAPLAGTLDVLLLHGMTPVIPRALLNLGGIANVTLSDGPLAFDTGPANCLIDATIAAATGGKQLYDESGRLAASGKVDRRLLTHLLSEPYYRLPPPKSTGRELFSGDYVPSGTGLSLPDLVATLTELTAITVAEALRPHGVREVYASGGGVHNPILTARLQHHLGTTGLLTSDRFGLPVDAKEGYLMGLIGYLTWHGIPGVLAGASGTLTGADHARVLGRISPGDAPLRLPDPGVRPVALRVVD
ncbi:anhydro-N-acetylmuramic acid kinase [Flexivirga meconopsidis]|uniref:anhydro-N-acetylmuramic acid kinase n=1 Tax=Flexivirga meconopsidis TaxID=2977121 RepID=UPI002240E295